MAEKAGRGASALQGAATGAATGSVFGVPGALVGGALGLGLGAAFGGDEYRAMSEAELAELKRRKELGTLGLTDEEYQTLYAQGSGKMEQQFQKLEADRAALAATEGLGAGQAAKVAIEQEAEQVKVAQELNKDLMLLDMKERLNEESRMAELTGQASTALQADQNAIFASLLSMGQLAGGLGMEAEGTALGIEKLKAKEALEESFKSLGIDLKELSWEEAVAQVTSIYSGE